MKTGDLVYVKNSSIYGSEPLTVLEAGDDYVSVRHPRLGRSTFPVSDIFRIKDMAKFKKKISQIQSLRNKIEKIEKELFHKNSENSLIKQEFTIKKRFFIEFNGMVKEVSENEWLRTKITVENRSKYRKNPIKFRDSTGLRGFIKTEKVKNV